MPTEDQAVQRKDKQKQSLNKFSTYYLVWQNNSICEVFWDEDKASASCMH